VSRLTDDPHQPVAAVLEIVGNQEKRLDEPAIRHRSGVVPEQSRDLAMQPTDREDRGEQREEFPPDLTLLEPLKSPPGEQSPDQLMRPTAGRNDVTERGEEHLLHGSGHVRHAVHDAALCRRTGDVQSISALMWLHTVRASHGQDQTPASWVTS